MDVAQSQVLHTVCDEEDTEMVGAHMEGCELAEHG